MQYYLFEYLLLNEYVMNLGWSSYTYTYIEAPCMLKNVTLARYNNIDPRSNTNR